MPPVARVRAQCCSGALGFYFVLEAPVRSAGPLAASSRACCCESTTPQHAAKASATARSASSKRGASCRLTSCTMPLGSPLSEGMGTSMAEPRP